MSALKKPMLTVQEYLALEEVAPYKSEFWNGEMFAMAGASNNHNYIRESLSVEIGGRLKGSTCRTVSADQRLKVDRTGLYCYPDLMILCDKREFDPDNANTVLNPVAIVEVLSPSTEKYDRGAKFRHYEQIASLKEYLLVAQDEAVIERFVRQADGSWALVSFVGLADTLSLTSVPMQIPLVDIYAGVTLENPSGM